MNLLDVEVHATSHDLDQDFPTDLKVSAGGHEIDVDDGSTAYGYVQEGMLTIYHPCFTQDLTSGMFFSVPGPARLSPFIGMACIRNEYQGVNMSGGPVEILGRLKYIDGCSDSLLVAPVIKGDPCLNYLYVPPHLDQTAHTHPSVRIGVVIDGCGYCLSKDERHELTAGKIFILPRDEVHSFHTEEDCLRIVVYHPDSDFGPTHETHPMINRTLVNGESLAGENQYRTRKIQRLVTE
ncbi:MULTISPECIES: AraC family ligand binding domain-containing protein [Burkholderia]|uniref:cupin domain-containing protein n=1 Tax=Burkholderia TaxID=32008 RepID=UPI0009EB5321|nr:MULTISPECIES: AraC family ligand binding domain-containing protein [Burkholderia]